MEIIYRAKDGTEFNDKYECQEYELTGDLKSSNYKLFNDEMQPTNDPAAVWYAKFNSYKYMEAFNQICEEQGVWGIDCDIDHTKPLAFYYDTTNSCYIQYTTEIERLENELSSLKEQYEKLLSE